MYIPKDGDLQLYADQAPNSLRIFLLKKKKKNPSYFILNSAANKKTLGIYLLGSRMKRQVEKKKKQDVGFKK